jgi:lysine 6-dehydrogenase
MKFLVIGSGMMGSALAFDLARSNGVEYVTLADEDFKKAESVSAKIASNKVHPVGLDVNSYNEVVALMKEHSCTIGAVSYRFNYVLSRAAIDAKIHFCDLGGNDDVVEQQLKLDAQAKQANVLIVPNCGLAPGLANILAARGAEQFKSVDTIRMRVGGLPQHPQPPFNYQLVFSAEGLLNEYSGTSTVIRDGKLTQVETLTEVEEIEFGVPFGTLEAFHTSGGASLTPKMFEGKVRNLDYKTVRYRGHCEKFKALLDVGFGSDEPISIGASLLTDREIFIELLKRKLPSGGPDVVLLRVEVIGTRGAGRETLTYNLIDFLDDVDNISSMMRTTSFPTSLIAQFVASGTIAARGVFTPEQCVPLRQLLEGLRDRNVQIKERWS